MIDIQRYIDDKYENRKLYGNPVTDIRVQCPFCQHDAKYKLYISIEKKVVHCFRCGYSSSWVKFIMDIERCSYLEALRKLYVRPSLKSFEKKPLVIKREDSSLPEDFIRLDQAENSIQYKRYLKNRGFGKSYWIKYNLGVAKSIPHRVIIPIEDGYYQARAILPTVLPKYLNPKTPARYHIFNAQALYNYEEVIICEGAFSAMSVGDNAIALLGKEPIKEKVTRLVKAPVTHYIVVVEPDAYATISGVCKELYYNNKKVSMWIYKTGDPNDSNDFSEIEYNDYIDMKMRLG